MTPPPAAEATAESLIDLVYRARLAPQGWSPSRRVVSILVSTGVYGVLLGLLLIHSETPRTTPPRVIATVNFFEVADPMPPAPRAVPHPSQATPETPSLATPITQAPAPSLDTPMALPTAPQAATVPAGSQPSGAASGPASAPSPVTAPRFDAAYLNNPDPIYPAQSRRIGEEGRVILRVLVSVQGKADQVEIRATSGSPRLDQAAIAAVKRWRFDPARQGATAIAAWVLVPISFHLDA